MRNNLTRSSLMVKNRLVESESSKDKEWLCIHHQYYPGSGQIMTDSGTRSKDCKPKHFQEDNRPKIPQVCIKNSYTSSWSEYPVDIDFRKANNGEMCQNTSRWPKDSRARGVNPMTEATLMIATKNSSTPNLRQVKTRISVQEFSERCLPPRQGHSDEKSRSNKGVRIAIDQAKPCLQSSKSNVKVLDTHQWTW